MLIIRKIEPSEAETFKKIGRKAFTGAETFFVTKPKEAMVAVLDGNVVGGIAITYLCSNGVKIGYFDVAFIDPAYHGQGIGNELYQKTSEYLWEQGCTALTAAVKDDNAGSWKAFLNCGFQRVTLTEAVRQLGLSAMIKQYFAAPIFICNGMELYLAVKNGQVTPKKENTAKYILMYLFVNLLLLTPGFLTGRKNFAISMLAYFSLLLGGVITSYAGTLFSKRNWSFRLNSGGAVLVAFVNFLTSGFPMIGNWYPEKYENTRDFRKSLGIPALFDWVFHISAVCLSIAFYESFLFFRFTNRFGIAFLVYRIIAVYPFESFGGRRVYQWNKGLYAVLAVISALLIWVVSFIL